MKQKEKIDRHVNVKMPQIMYKQLIKLSIEESNKTGELMTLSKVIRNILKEKLN